jgi:polar amino acid transport system substrate-binding protein
MTGRVLAGRRFLAAAAALVLVVGACSDDGKDPETGSPVTSSVPVGPEAGKALDTVVEGKLTACTDTPRAPFEFDADGQLDGIDIELVRAVSGRLALAPAFVELHGDQLFEGLDDGRCDLVASSVAITPERQKTLDFSAGYIRIHQSLLVRKADQATVGDLAALAGRTVGVEAASAGAAYARRNAAGVSVKEFAGTDELLSAFAAGQVDAVLHDLPVNAYEATTSGASVVVKVFTEEGGDEYGLVMKKGAAALKSAVDGALAQVRSDDTYPTILRRFLGDSAGQI